MEELRCFKKDNNVLIGQQEVQYQTICEDFPVKSEDNAVIGTMFTYTYMRTDIKDMAGRPVIFAYNGGPGSSSLWLHTGLLAPKIVNLENPLKPPMLPPFELKLNENCLLDICDIVVIDPMGTGYSQVFDDQRQNEAFTVERDALIFAQFMQYWLRKYNRWQSPKYLLGESYGTVRTAVLANTLLGGPTAGGSKLNGISIDGMIMMGTGIFVDPRVNWYTEHGLPEMALNLPTMAAVNWYYHQDDKPPLKDFIKDARAFIEEDLLQYFYMGYRMPRDRSEDILQRLSYYSGLSVELLQKKNCNISLTDFSKEILSSTGEVVGMYDGRFVMNLMPNIGIEDPVADESAMGTYTPAYFGGFMEISDHELGIALERDYSIINFQINGMWKWDSPNTPFQNLQRALRRSPQTKLLVCNGCYDMVTTIGQAQYMTDHLNAEEGQVTVKEYPSGHMAYIDAENCRDLCNDIRKFISQA